MAKCTDAQRALLSNAATRDDGSATVPAKTRKPAAAKVAASLIARKLMRETRAKPGMPIWRKDGDGRGVSLVVTPAGRDAIDITPSSKEADKTTIRRRGTNENTRPPQRESSRSRQLIAEANSREEPNPAAERVGPRPGTKLALVIEMLAKPQGATIGEIVGATGWQPHTARAVLTGLRKRGFVIERGRVDGTDTSNYRIASTASRAA